MFDKVGRTIDTVVYHHLDDHPTVADHRNYKQGESQVTRVGT